MVLRKQKRDTPDKDKLVRNGFLSPLRYPGGKSWFLKIVRKWLKNQPNQYFMVEPFAGGANISLAAVHEGLVTRASFAERDKDVAAVWRVVLNGKAGWLERKIRSFPMTRRKVKKILAQSPETLKFRAFQCLLRNRTARGGVIAKGAGLLRDGEDGNGIGSRWYPKTLAARVKTISSLKLKLKFKQGDGFKLIRKYLRHKTAAFFVDPPYTQASKRLYTHWDIDHEQLFSLLSRAKGTVLMTYDDTSEIRNLANKYGFEVKSISMRTTHHQRKRELMIAKDFGWQTQGIRMRPAPKKPR